MQKDSRPTVPGEAKRLYEIAEFGDFQRLVASSQPAFLLRPANQVEQIRTFLSKRRRQCQSILVESHYIDRAFIDEYKEFYGTSFRQYSNACTRLHFFSIGKKELKKIIKGLLIEVADATRAGTEVEQRNRYDALCKDFSDKFYLGFMVVKPLPATRIGRTVIRHPQHDSTTGAVVFPCTRVYTAHVLGLELSVCGLPFQQQDRGMSACASTATWASLSHYSEFEHLQIPSPAAITKFANAQMTALGRLIPQEKGLTVDQMCKAIEAAGLSPYLMHFRDLDAKTSKAFLYSSIKSGFAPILIISTPESKHAVTVSGMLLADDAPYRRFGLVKIREESERMRALFVNDDRLGPYQRANLQGATGLRIAGDGAQWNMTQLLIPLHIKIRYAFVGLSEFALRLAYKSVEFHQKSAKNTKGPESKINLEFWISKSRNYRRQALFGKHPLSPQAGYKLNQLVSLPRYIGVVRLEDASFGNIDVLVDSTNTNSHTNILLVLGRGINSVFGRLLIERLAGDLDSPLLISKS